MKKILLLLLLASSLFAQDPFDYFAKRRTTVTQCNTVDTYHVSVGTYLALNHTTNLSIREGIMIGQQYRIRQNGSLYGITLYCASTATVTSVQVRVWRKVGSTYERIGTTENFYASLVAGQNNTIYFTRPITGCLEGDYYSLVYDATASPFQGVADANCTLRYITTTSDSTGFAWDSKSSVVYGIPATLYMLNPNLVFIGDSQISGATSNLETTLASTYSTSLPYLVGTAMGYTWQNMGLGGNSSTQVLARFPSDMLDLHPTAGIVLVNVNDIAGGVSSNTIVSNNQTMVENMVGNRIRPYFIENLPYSNTTIAKQRQFDSVRSRVRTIVLANGGFVISTVSTFGTYLDSGDVGNLWKLNPTYTSDGVHLNSAGNTLLASLITSSLVANGCASYNITATIPVDTNGLRYYWTDETAVGTLTNWTDLKSGVNFTQSTSANKPVKTSAVFLDSTDELRASIGTITTTGTIEFIMKLTDTNSYADQLVLGIRGSTPTLTVLACKVTTNAISGAYKFGTGYYNGVGYTHKNYAVGSLYNKYALITIVCDSVNKQSVYFNGVLQTSGGALYSTTYNSTGVYGLGTGLKNALFRRITYWSVKSSQAEIIARYNIYNSLGLIDP